MINKDIYEKALLTYGIEAQTIMLFEEMAELQNALTKLIRGRSTEDDVLTELADVSIMIEQMALFYGRNKFEQEKERKLERLEERLNNKGNKKLCDETSNKEEDV